MCFVCQNERIAVGIQIDDLMQIVLTMRNEAKINKDYQKADTIRQRLLAAGFEIKDGKEGTTYTINTN